MTTIRVEETCEAACPTLPEVAGASLPMRIGLIAGGYPPELDGIGEYTSRMARTLAQRLDVQEPLTVFTSSVRRPTEVPGVDVVPFFTPQHPASFSSLLSVCQSRQLDWLVLQYNPFNYGRRGFCPWVPSTLVRIKRIPGGPRVAVMFHETCIPKWPWRFGVMYLWQQPIFRWLCRVADLAFVSTERWLGEVSAANRHLPCHPLPVGSNVPLCDISQIEARGILGISPDRLVLGVFGTAHFSRRLDWIAAAARAITTERPDTMVLYVGPHGAAVSEACAGLEVIDAGIQPEASVGNHLRAMGLVLAPFSDGISTRRTSVVAALQHGIPVATTLAPWTDSLFLREPQESLILSPGDRCERFVSDVVAWMAVRNWKPTVPCAQLTAFHGRHFAWDRIAQMMIGELQTWEIPL